MQKILCFSDSIFLLDSGPGVAPVGVGDAGVVQTRDGGVQAATFLSRANLMCQHRSNLKKGLSPEMDLAFVEMYG